MVDLWLFISHRLGIYCIQNHLAGGRMPHSVLIVVSNKKTGDTYLSRSYPDDDINNNNKIELYRTPVYKIVIKGMDSTNASQIKEWPAVRFMPYWNDPKTTIPAMVPRIAILLILAPFNFGILF